ncbi:MULTISPECIES: hypothetical protein [Nocardiaceae]|jgi:bacteriorhodopsin|uniref:hypothetical protein n=1 Tax=Nocardiaceae TaxID=85025 RepID=UPI00056480C1|nr:MULTISPECIES: hypothetical protein [Rhodococcus]OZF03172.1 hypothetical protein CH301_06945 [Rhodococcus sp. 15-1189-1-1a]OZF16975.1 hypothetical protein CH299_07495 [Rhodococcus sp. 14-2686-1-2]OZF54511.1 hypothetical protein CH293_07280 [Rhodococcus sp. 14-2470-1b]
MNTVRATFVACVIGVILVVTSGPANASPGSPSAPQYEWLPDFLYPVWSWLWWFGYLADKGVNPFPIMFGSS